VSLFYEMRFDAAGKEIPDFVLNKAPVQTTTIYICIYVCIYIYIYDFVLDKAPVQRQVGRGRSRALCSKAAVPMCGGGGGERRKKEIRKKEIL
jgi:hypothetical protein